MYFRTVGFVQLVGNLSTTGSLIKERLWSGGLGVNNLCASCSIATHRCRRRIAIGPASMNLMPATLGPPDNNRSESKCAPRDMCWLTFKSSSSQLRPRKADSHRRVFLSLLPAPSSFTFHRYFFAHLYPFLMSPSPRRVRFMSRLAVPSPGRARIEGLTYPKVAQVKDYPDRQYWAEDLHWEGGPIEAHTLSEISVSSDSITNDASESPTLLEITTVTSLTSQRSILNHNSATQNTAMSFLAPRNASASAPRPPLLSTSSSNDSLPFLPPLVDRSSSSGSESADVSENVTPTSEYADNPIAYDKHGLFMKIDAAGFRNIATRQTILLTEDGQDAVHSS